MKRNQLKEIIKNILVGEIDLHEDGIGSSAGMIPANSTSNISGYDSPFGSMVKRKINGRKKSKKKGKKY